MAESYLETVRAMARRFAMDGGLDELEADLMASEIVADEADGLRAMAPLFGLMDHLRPITTDHDAATYMLRAGRGRYGFAVPARERVGLPAVHEHPASGLFDLRRAAMHGWAKRRESCRL